MGLLEIMSATVLILLLTCIAPAAGVVFVFWRIGSGRVSVPPTTGWIDEFSVERYRPMMRLLDADELRFAHSRPGATARLIAQLRRERCRILRGYLRSLTTDFTRVLTVLRLLIAHSNVDRPDLAALLIRSQALFALGMVLIHVQLLLYRAGIGTVSVAPVLELFEVTRLELRTLIPRVMESPA
jgi:hypothetical protein